MQMGWLPSLRASWYDVSMRPVVLLILDGWGYSLQQLGNAIATAKKPAIDNIQRNFPSLTLQASGNSVGLAWGETGNSEVGHLTIGAGRTVFQYSTRISRSIESGDFFNNPALLSACDHALNNKGSLHIIGLLGSGTVHSSMDHLFALLKLAKQKNISRVYLHLFSDGKDSGLKELPMHLAKLRDQMGKIGIGTIATIIGRNDPMDRDNNWDRTKRAFELMTKGTGEMVTELEPKIQQLYGEGKEDSGLPAMLIEPNGIVKDNDAVVFFNFREDSMRQISRSFLDPGLNTFERVLPKNLFVALMTQYFEDPALNLHIAFPLPEVNNGLAETLSAAGKKQMHIAETEKYAHATYFFNCLRNVPYEGEEDFLIESFKNDSEHPEMKAGEIADKCIAELERNVFDFTIINLANADVLSHIGNLENTIKGVEAVDAAVGRIAQTVAAKDGILVITADHGNAESLLYKGSGEAETKHDMNPVPLYIVMREFQRARSDDEILETMHNPRGLISDVAPTILDLMHMQIPSEMTGTSLANLLA